MARLREQPDELAALAAHASELGQVHRRGALAELVESVALPAEHMRRRMTGQALSIASVRRRSGRNLGGVVIAASTPDLAAPARSASQRPGRAARPVATHAGCT